MTLEAKAQRLRKLHHGDRPVVLPNVWDAASAQLVQARGFPAIATSSGAVAGSLGYPDDDVMPPSEGFAAIARISAAVGLPVTADIEAGYGLEPHEIVAKLLGAGAVGCNIEDTAHHGTAGLVAAEPHAERLAAIKRAARDAGVDIVLNARVDVFLGVAGVTPELIDEGVRRARLYVEAGADCVYPITLADERAIGEFVAAVGAPVNIMLRPPAPGIARLAELGVARISLAGGLYRLVYRTLDEELGRLAAEAL